MMLSHKNGLVSILLCLMYAIESMKVRRCSEISHLLKRKNWQNYRNVIFLVHQCDVKGCKDNLVIHGILTIMPQAFLTPATPHLGLSGAFTFYASESEWSPRFPGAKVSGAFPRPYFSTHGTPFKSKRTYHCQVTLKCYCDENFVFSFPVFLVLISYLDPSLLESVKFSTS